MSVIKDLKQKPEYNFNLVDLIQDSIGVSNKTKYVELFVRLLEEKITNELTNIEDVKREIKRNTKYIVDGKNYSINIKDLSPFQLKLYRLHVEVLNHLLQLQTMNDFVFFNEKGFIPENDLTKIKTFNQLQRNLNVAMLKNQEKILKKEVYKVYEDEEWLMIRPLTHLASLKYGANTKWCTSSKGNPYTFYDYTRHGMLIYCINKKTGQKVAIHKNAKSTDITFWDENDSRKDSLFCDLPMNILGVIKEHITEYDISNYDMCSDECKKGYKQYESQEKECISERGEIARPIGENPGGNMTTSEVSQQLKEAAEHYDSDPMTLSDTMSQKTEEIAPPEEYPESMGIKSVLENAKSVIKNI